MAEKLKGIVATAAELATGINNTKMEELKMINQVYLGLDLPEKVDLENSKYKSVFVLPNRIYGQITIFKSKRITPMPFMVGYNHSTIFFKTYEEAREYVSKKFENGKY